MDEPEYYPLDITKEQRANLETLYEKSPETVKLVKFDMAAFFHDNFQSNSDIIVIFS